jgi:hypothetical protein
MVWYGNHVRQNRVDSVSLLIVHKKLSLLPLPDVILT